MRSASLSWPRSSRSLVRSEMGAPALANVRVRRYGRRNVGYAQAAE